jgi:AraC-like DNA-binding protein/quercetin dioxygenase-like cupin family protein
MLYMVSGTPETCKTRSDPVRPIDVLQFAFPPRTRIAAQRHTYRELMYIVSGKLRIRIEDREYQARRSDLLLINSGHSHSIVDAGATGVNAIALCFEPEILQTGDSGEEVAEYLAPFLIQDSAACPLVEARTGVPAQALAVLKQIAADLPPASPRARLAVRTYLRLLLLLLVNHFAARNEACETLHRCERYSGRLRPLFGYLDSHFSEPVTVEQASKLLNMSPSHFMSFFKKATGQSFHSHLKAFRIGKATSLLRSTDYSVAEIAWQTGFRSASHFTSAFHAALGTTPRDYRENPKSTHPEAGVIALAPDAARPAARRQAQDLFLQDEVKVTANGVL